MNPRYLPCAPRTRVAPPFVAPHTRSGSNFSTMTSLSSGSSRSSFGKYMSDFKIIPAKKFYPLQVKVNVSKNDYFNVYIKGPDQDRKMATPNQQINGSVSSPPQKSQKVLTDRVFPYSQVLPAATSDLVLLFLHGAGFSALSWALLAKNISESVPGCFLVAIDLRGHGDSRTADESDFSFETLSEDVCRVYETLVKDCHLPGADESNEVERSENESGLAPPAKVFLVGHSMGGALAAYIGAKKSDRLHNVVGVCVIDVVEGSAMEALNGMKNVLKSRPTSFVSEEEAIEWSVRSGYIKKRESAKISMIGQMITQSEADKRRATAMSSAAKKGTNFKTLTETQQTRELGSLQEEEDEEEFEFETGNKTGTGGSSKTSSGQHSSKVSNQCTQTCQAKPYQDTTPIYDWDPKTGYSRESGGEYEAKSSTVQHTCGLETSKESVLPETTAMQTEPNYQAPYCSTMKSATASHESEKDEDEFESDDSKDQNRYPNSEILYDIRGENNDMKINDQNQSKINQKESKEDSKTKDKEIKEPERYTWRIDLFKTEPYWKSWFTGLSKNFLDSPGPKLLILAGVDRLDKELTVAQMQGKFQMLILPKAGHAVQEDAPEKVADALAAFIQRHRLALTDSSKYEPVYPGC